MLLFPEYAWLGLLLLPVLYILYRNYRFGRHEFGRMKGSGDVNRLFDAFTIKWFFSSLFFLLSLVFIILSLVGIKSEEREVRDIPDGMDIVFVLDISRSMMSDDITPNRLERSLTVINQIVSRNDGARFGLVVFKGSGLVLVPVTEDIEALHQFIDTVSPDLFSSRSTNLEAGLRTAFSTFPLEEERRKVVVLITDGEGHEGDGIEAASAAKEEEIELNVLAVGTEEGGRIPLGEEQYLRDREGNVVVTSLKIPELRRLADAAEGNFCRIDSNGTVNELIECMSIGSVQSSIQFIERGRYELFLFIAAVALILSLLVKVVPWHGSY